MIFMDFSDQFFNLFLSMSLFALVSHKELKQGSGCTSLKVLMGTDMEIYG